MGGASSGVGAGGTGTTGAGGTGGIQTGSCDVLAIDGPPRSPAPYLGNHELLAPSLVSTELDASSVAVVYIEKEPTAPPPFQSSSVALDDPWGPWPDDLGKSAFHGQSIGFATGSGEEGRFSMLMTDEPNNQGNGPTGMVVWAPFAGVSGAMGQYFDDFLPGYPRFVTMNGKDALAGFSRPVAPGANLEVLDLAYVTVGGGPAVSGVEAAACALDATLTGAAIPHEGGFLATLSNGRPFGTCFDDDLTDGPPSRIQVLSMPSGPGSAMVTFEHLAPDTYIFQTALAKVSDGAWALWERIPFGPASERQIQILRLDTQGFPKTGQIIDLGWGNIGTPVAIAGVGPLVAIATTRDESITDRILDIHVLTATGEPVGEIALHADENFEMQASVALLGSPEGGRLLVAWTEAPGTNSNVRRVRVARIACVGP